MFALKAAGETELAVTLLLKDGVSDDAKTRLAQVTHQAAQLAAAHLWLEGSRVLFEEARMMAMQTSSENGLQHIPRRFVMRKGDGNDALSRLWDALCEKARELDNKSPFFRGKGHGVFVPNPCGVANCSAFQRFCNVLEGAGLLRAPNISTSGNANTLANLVSSGEIFLAFHGTAESSIDPICCNGFDTDRRGTAVGQAYGPGEYFGVTPDISDNYTKGSEAMIICAVFDNHTSIVSRHKSNTILVVNNPKNYKDVCYAIPVRSWSSRHRHTVRQHQCSYPASRWNGKTSCTHLSQSLDAVLSVFEWLDSDGATAKATEQRNSLQRETIISAIHAVAATREGESITELIHTLDLLWGDAASVLGTAADSRLSAGNWYKCGAKKHYFLSTNVPSACPQCDEDAAETDSDDGGNVDDNTQSLKKF